MTTRFALKRALPLTGYGLHERAHYEHVSLGRGSNDGSNKRTMATRLTQS